tara:strand:+ start:61 stop:294 length:234 start_codon:yes stop_codon:yes gene_type:complete
MKNNNKVSNLLGRFIGTLLGLITIFFICVNIGQEWAVSLLVAINIISLEQVNWGFVILPAIAGSWCFTQAEKFEKNK